MRAASNHPRGKVGVLLGPTWVGWWVWVSYW
jgi:hypothetical protein